MLLPKKRRYLFTITLWKFRKFLPTRFYVKSIFDNFRVTQCNFWGHSIIILISRKIWVVVVKFLNFHIVLSLLSYLQCKRRVHGFVEIIVDPEWARSSHKWRKSKDALIQNVGFHVESTLTLNIVLHCYNFDTNCHYFHHQEMGLNLLRKWTLSLMMETLHLEIDPWLKLQFICVILQNYPGRKMGKIEFSTILSGQVLKIGKFQDS